MSFVIFDKNTTVIKTFGPYNNKKDSFTTEAAAKAALTRLKNRGQDVSNFSIMEYGAFKVIEKTKTVISLMSGLPVEISVNTPYCCDPSTEKFWTM